MPLTGERVIEMLRGAGEPTRLRVLSLLSREELSVLELTRMLGQSQPRVSRHLRLLTEAGLTERFADGAWAFYRLPAAGAAREMVRHVLDLVEPGDPLVAADLQALEAVREERRAQAADYFARNAEQWNALRGLHTDEAEVEAAILRAAGPGPFHRLIDLGTGTGRMLNLLGPRAESAVGLDLSRSMLNIARAEAHAASLPHAEVRHGDIFRTGLPDAAGDLVVIHQVLHYLADPRRGAGRGGPAAGAGRTAAGDRLRAARARGAAGGAQPPPPGLRGRGSAALGEGPPGSSCSRRPPFPPPTPRA